MASDSAPPSSLSLPTRPNSTLMPALPVMTLSAEVPVPMNAEPVRVRFSRLAPRVTEVATLSAAVGRKVLSGATNALNAVRRPAIAIDRFGFVLDANPAMDCVFDDCIHVRNRRLFVADVEAKTCLERLTDRLRTASDTDVLPCDPIIVRRKRRAPVVIRVLPVHGAARTPFLGARALLTFASVEPRPGPKPSLLAKLFGLTPAEAKLASLMTEGISVEQAAEALEISRETARNQLKAVFAKTSTHRQGELVALLSGL